jgi:hypothetical protein
MMPPVGFSLGEQAARDGEPKVCVTEEGEHGHVTVHA